MEIINVDNLKEYKGYLIGRGTTAKCYKIDDNNVAKLFHKSFSYYLNIDDAFTMNKFETLSKIDTETYKGMDKILVKDRKIVGYIYPFVEGKVLHQVRKKLYVNDILKNYGKMIEDTKRISSLGVEINDLHDKNIIYDGSLKIIDLDRWKIRPLLDVEKINSINIRKINQEIIKIIFGAKQYETICFDDFDLMRLYYSMNSKEDFVRFLELLKKECLDLENLKFSKIKRKVKHINKYDNYYNHF